MIPRGEVGLIFASIGTSLTLRGSPIISTSIYSAVVIMLILTTVVTPPLLKISLARGDRLKEARRPETVSAWAAEGPRESWDDRLESSF
jgi:Kef-type K+ transport system membrane component KefB